MQATILGVDEPRALASLLRLLQSNAVALRASADAPGIDRLLSEMDALARYTVCLACSLGTNTHTYIHTHIYI